MAGETLPEARAPVVRAAGLGDLRTFGLARRSALDARPDDGDVSWLAVVLVPIGGHDQQRVVGQGLGLEAVAHRAPSLLRTDALQPVVLRVGQQRLRVLGWAQDVDPEMLGRRGDERAAMRVFA